MLVGLAVVLVAGISLYLYFAAPNLSSGSMAIITPVLIAFVVVTLLVLARQAGRWRREYSLDDDDSNDMAHGRRVSGLSMARGRKVYFRR